MKKLVFASLCLLSVTSYGQSNKFTFQIGSQYELPRKTEDLAFFGDSASGIINLSMKKEELNVIRFDAKSLNQTDDKVISLERTRNFNSEEVTDFHNGNYFWLHSDWDKDAKKESLSYDKIDVATGKLLSQDNKLFDASKIAGTGAASGFDYKITGKYKFCYSQDHKKLLVTYRLIPENRNDKENYDKIGFYVYDDQLNKLWSNEFTMPYTEAVMDNSDFSIDANGNAYLLAKVYDSDKRKEKDKETGKPGYNFEVLKFTKDTKAITHSVITVGDYFIEEASLIENPSHDMIVACTYSKKSKSKGTDGVFLATVNQAGQIIKYKNGYYEFPLADLEKFESARAKRKMENKDDYEAPHVKVRKVLTQPDGSIFLACEESYVDVYNDFSRGTTTYTYYYKDILAAKINASGTFAWLTKIPKNQKKVLVLHTGGFGGGAGAAAMAISISPSIMTNNLENGPGSMSFKLINDASGYYFLYLDNKKNLDLAEDESPKYHVDGHGGQVMVAKIDVNGNLTKELLFDTREEDVMIYPTQFHKINSNQFIGRAKVKKNLFEPILITVK
jgi:hypothetical protein